MTAADRDQALVARWQGGDPAARAELVRAYAPMIERAAERRASRGDVDDLAAEGSIALLRAIDAYDASYGVPFSAYASRRVCEAMSRHAAVDDPEIDVADLPSGVQDSPEDFAAASESRRLVRADLIAAMASLTDREAEVISRRYFADEDTTTVAVGKALGISGQRVREIERHALAKLRTLMPRPEAA